MRNTLIGFLCLLCLPFVVWAEQTGDGPLRQDHPDRHIVQKGDTLWDISAKFLNTPWLWPEIWHVNPQIKNPHLIFPGDEIRLVYIDGKPRLVLKRGPGDRTVKLGPSKRIEPLDTVVPAISLDAISPFLNKGRIVTRKQLSDAAYIVSGHEGRIVTGAGDKIYARDNVDIIEQYGSYGVYRAGQTYVDPQTKEVLGIEALELGTGKATAKERDISTMKLLSSNQDIRIQDQLLPTEATKVIPTFFPSSPENDVRGQIIAVLGGVSQVGQYNVVAINRGEREGIEVGNVMAIYHKSGFAKDRVRKDVVELPAERGGLLMVFRVFEKLSYGLVLKAQRPLAVLDEVRNP